MGEWTRENMAAAQAEGWDIFQSDEYLRIERIDDPDLETFGYDEPKFPSDMEVWRHVLLCAEAGLELHGHALRYIETHSPIEYAEIMAWWTGN